jgi:hypothetical protein
MLHQKPDSNDDNDAHLDPYSQHGDDIIDQDAPVQHRRVRLLYRLVTESPIPDAIKAWTSSARRDYQGGRQRDLTDVAILVVILILALENAPLHFTKGAAILHHRLLPESRRLLGLGDDDNFWHWYDRLQNGFARLISLMNPSPTNGHQRQTHERDKRRRHKRDVEDAQLTAELQEKLDWFCNTLLQTTVLAKIDLLQGWEGNTTIDATAFRVFTKGRKTALFASIEPDAGWYMRTSQHEDTADPKKARVVFFGYEMHILTPASNTGDSALDTFVKPAIGISCVAPSKEVSLHGLKAIQAAFRAFSSYMKDGIVVADKGYFANSDPENLQLPVRELGLRFITDYKYDQLGPIGEIGGAIQIEGHLYCPATPSHLQWATKRARSFKQHLARFPRIDEVTFVKWIHARGPWRVTAKERADAKGTVPYRCPAIGPSAKVLCPVLRPKDYEMNKNKPGRVKVQPSRLPTHPDRICTASSIHVKRTHLAKFRQDVVFASEAWFRLYRSGRNFIEGYNAYVKDGTKSALGNAAKRPARGYAKQYVLATTLMFASNLRLIEAHIRKQQQPTILPSTMNPIRRREATQGHTYDPATGEGQPPLPKGITNGFLEDIDGIDED